MVQVKEKKYDRILQYNCLKIKSESNKLPTPLLKKPIISKTMYNCPGSEIPVVYSGPENWANKHNNNNTLNL